MNDDQARLEYHILLCTELAFLKGEHTAYISKQVITNPDVLEDAIHTFTQDGFTFEGNDFSDDLIIHLPPHITLDYFLVQ